ncbi:MAG: hypothetical protein RL094_462 [Candidatus Parcubacteria bacterium]|jgi:hypothetical protein
MNSSIVEKAAAAFKSARQGTSLYDVCLPIAREERIQVGTLMSDVGKLLASGKKRRLQGSGRVSRPRALRQVQGIRLIPMSRAALYADAQRVAEERGDHLLPEDY